MIHIEKEIRIRQLIADGWSNADISKEAQVWIGTVRTIRKLSKLRSRGRIRTDISDKLRRELPEIMRIVVDISRYHKKRLIDNPLFNDLGKRAMDSLKKLPY